MTVQTGASPTLLYDGGFPREAYQLHWPAPGSPEVAREVAALLGGAGVPTRGDAKRGYDHGVFVPLLLVTPAADVPTLQLSLHASLDPALHLRIGAALAPLRDRGVLIVGSGFATHNMRDFFDGPGRAGDDKPEPWLREFEGWLRGTLTAVPAEERVRRLAAGDQATPHFRRAHPREEHFTPLLVTVGAAAPAAMARVLGGDGADAAGVTPGGEVAGVAEEGGAEEGRGSVLFSRVLGGTVVFASYAFGV